MSKEQKKATAAADANQVEASRVNKLLTRASLGDVLALELNVYACDSSSDAGDSPFNDAES